ncbi:N-acetyltransferase [Oceanobacillus caeni]|uniref:Acetyltransferase n=1 Tax=Oceanobacillus caeni TaxID=405946 RepID=A0ABR5MJ93_9BACI|nr:GNAT family N-acetyltransferase [Oceanobacillus caeni]KKE78747.1 acetyltransferase [Bacilli bacterium VT-13-104]PZD85032.1 N-acetyltransferase [Bacilli bacterium]KPH75161.1 acetyltransferase [Oceanobacillus caeni]MCR1836163.1 N-acetyltransferase [Oceanobacillus caeni]PZD85887.1 N-acetyltransferase [Bacilli bacterium]
MVTINKAENIFYVGDDVKEPIAELTFNQSSGNNIVVDHTYVSDELRGQGIAGQLVEKVVAYARENNKKIIPLCPYVKRKLEETPEYHDVLSEK